MKNHPHTASTPTIVSLALLSCLIVGASSARAALRIWDAEDIATSAFWSDPVNWDGNTTVPVNGDDISFAAVGSVTSNNIPNLQLGSFHFPSPGYSLQGVALTLMNGIEDVSGSNTNGIPLILGASQSFTNLVSPLVLNGNITNNGFNLSLQVDGGITIAGIIGSGPGSLIKNGAGTLALNGANTFGGGLIINEGTVTLGNANSIPNGQGVGDVLVGAAGVLEVNGANRTANGLYGSGNVANNGAAAAVLTVGANSTNSAGTFTGLLANGTSALGLTKLNTNTLTLTAANTYTGPTLVSGGTLVLGAGATLASSAITVSPGAVLDASSIGGGLVLNAGQALTAGRSTNGPADVLGSVVLQGGTLSVLNSANPGTLTLSGGLTLQGGIADFKLRSITAPGGGTNDLVSLSGSLGLLASTTIKPTFVDGTFSTSPYTLVSGATSIAGSTANLQATLPRGLNATFGTTPSTLTITIGGIATPGSLVWNSPGGNWDVNGSFSWLNGASPDVFLDFDNVTFTDVGAGPVGLTGPVAPGNISMNNTVAYTFTGVGAMGGSGTFTKSGSGTLTFQNSSSQSYAGPTIINGGIVLADFNNVNTPPAQILYGGAATNSLVLGGGDFRISSRTGIIVSQVFSGTTVNAGASTVDQSARQSNGNMGTFLGALTRNIGGTLDIQPQNNPNTGGADLTGIFTSSTNVNGIVGGYITRSVDNAWATRGANGQTNLGVFNGNLLPYAHLPAETNATSWVGLTNNVDISSVNLTATANTTVNTLRFNQANRTLTLSGTNKLANGGLLVTANAGASSITGGALAGATNADLVVIQLNPANPFVISSPIVNNGTTPTALTKSGVGILQLTANNSYSGTTYINAGTLQVGNGGTSGGISNSAALVDNGNLTFNRSDNLGVSLAISGTGNVTKQGAATLFLTGNNTYQGTTTISAGTLQVGAGATVGGISNSASVANNGAIVFNRSDSIGFNGLISGNGSLTKLGAGTLTLGNTNNYLGSTTISAGRLALGPSASLLNSTPITVSSGTTFDVSQPGGMTLNGAFAQTLTGSGTVTGSVTTAGGVLIIPGSSVGTLAFKNDLTLNGGRCRFEVAQGSNDLITVDGALSLNSGQAQVVVLGSPLANGSYKLFQYGSLNGDPANIPVVGFAQAGQLAYLTNQTAGQIDLVIYTGSGSNLTWVGNGIDNNWDFNSTVDWSGPSVFKNNDNVLFDDSSANQTVNLVGNLFPGSVTVNSTLDYIFSGAGIVSGGSGLTKNNSGTLTVLTANDYAGPTTVNAGTLQLGNGATAGSIAAGDVSNGSAIVFNEPAGETVVTAPIIGAGTLSTVGAGSTVTLAANNNWGGLTTIGTGATLQLGSGGGTGSSGSGNFQDDGALVYNRSGTLTVSGNITGNGSVTVQGSGTFTFNDTNTHTNGTTVAAGATLQLGGGNPLPEGPTAGLATVNGVLELNGRDEVVNGLAGAGNIRNNNGTITNTLTIGQGDAGTSGVVTLNAVIQNNTGAGGVVAIRKVGAGQFNVGGASTYSGGTYMIGGAIRAGNNATFGVGPIIFDGGLATMRMNNGRVIPNTVIVTNGGGEILTEANAEYNGQIIGASDQILRWNMINVGGNTMSLDAGMNGSPFTGTFLATNGAGTWRFNGSTGLGGVTWDVEGTVNLFPRNGGQNIRLGALTGTSSAFVRGANTAAGTTTYIIGEKNVAANFPGTLADGTLAAGGVPLAIVKAGTATQTLSGTLSYGGNTTVSNGVLALSGTAVIPSTSPIITLVAPGVLDVTGAGGTLTISGTNTIRGSGALTGNLLMTGGNLAPGFSIGALTVSGTATLAGTSTMEINPTNTPNSDRLVAGGTLTYGGILTVTNLGTFSALTNGTYVFQLFSAPTISGSFTATNLPALPPNRSWDTSALGSGQLKLVVNINPNPTNITTTIIGSTLQLTWPTDHIGWRLQTQTNSINVGLSTNWTFVAGADATNLVTFPITTNLNINAWRMIRP